MSRPPVRTPMYPGVKHSGHLLSISNVTRKGVLKATNEVKIKPNNNPKNSNLILNTFQAEEVATTATITEEATTSSSEEVEVAEAKEEDATKAVHHNPKDAQDHTEDEEGTNNPSNYVDNHFNFNTIKPFEGVNLKYMTTPSNNPTDNIISNTEPEKDLNKDKITKIELSKRDIITNNPDLKEYRGENSDNRKGDNNDNDDNDNSNTETDTIDNAISNI